MNFSELLRRFAPKRYARGYRDLPRPEDLPLLDTDEIGTIHRLGGIERALIEQGNNFRILYVRIVDDNGHQEKNPCPGNEDSGCSEKRMRGDRNGEEEREEEDDDNEDMAAGESHWIQQCCILTYLTDYGMVRTARLPHSDLEFGMRYLTLCIFKRSATELM